MKDKITIDNYKECILIMEKMINLTDDLSIKEKIKNCVSLSKEFLEKNKNTSFELYNYLDNETDSFIILQQILTDEKQKKICECMNYCLSIIIYYIYTFNNEKYLPELLEEINSSMVTVLKELVLSLTTV